MSDGMSCNKPTSSDACAVEIRRAYTRPDSNTDTPVTTCAVKVLVAATPISGPTPSSTTACADRPNVEVTTFVNARTGALPPTPSSDRRTSAVSPDWLNATVTDPGSATSPSSSLAGASVEGTP